MVAHLSCIVAQRVIWILFLAVIPSCCGWEKNNNAVTTVLGGLPPENKNWQCFWACNVLNRLTMDPERWTGLSYHRSFANCLTSVLEKLYHLCVEISTSTSTSCSGYSTSVINPLYYWTVLVYYWTTYSIAISQTFVVPCECSIYTKGVTYNMFTASFCQDNNSWCLLTSSDIG